MTKHDCAQIEELISARMDGATTPKEDARIERHLSDCTDCQTTALAFGRVDRELGAYLRATPVPAIATPWREASRTPPFIAGLLAQWRPATLALTTVLVLVVASVLAFGTFHGNTRQTQETSAPQSAYTSGGAAASSAAGAAPRVAASTAPTPAASTAPAAAPVLAPPAPAARATATSGGGGAAASSAPATSGAAGGAASSAAGTPSRIPMLGGGDPAATLNPVQQLRLGSATMLSICRPDCVASPQGATTLTEVIALLDAPLKRVEPATPTATTSAAGTVLRFTLADGQQVELRYSTETGHLTLPDGTLLLAPDALREVLSASVRVP
jgi:predicted anti-sigma-YlaC factor YlaD